LTIKQPITIAHTSDVHLGDADEPGGAFATRVFQRVIETTRQVKADILLIVGDLFDTNRVSKSTFDSAVELINKLPIPAVLLPGNHDCYDETSVYRRWDIEAACPNLRMLREAQGEVLTYPELGLKIWGRPVVVHEPEFQPLGGLPQRDGPWWHVVMAHGMYMGYGSPPPRSSPIWPKELEGTGWDYIALGHIHKFDNLSRDSTMVCYSGSPIGSLVGDGRGMITGTPGYIVVVRLVPEQPAALERVQLDGLVS
jgi:DNA repair exonuclease SbcCD nuclease subunit